MYRQTGNRIGRPSPGQVTDLACAVPISCRCGFPRRRPRSRSRTFLAATDERSDKVVPDACAPRRFTSDRARLRSALNGSSRSRASSRRSLLHERRGSRSTRFVVARETSRRRDRCRGTADAARDSKCSSCWPKACRTRRSPRASASATRPSSFTSRRSSGSSARPTAPTPFVGRSVADWSRSDARASGFRRVARSGAGSTTRHDASRRSPPGAGSSVLPAADAILGQLTMKIVDAGWLRRRMPRCTSPSRRPAVSAGLSGFDRSDQDA